MSLITPLRYPGGKRRLLPYLARVIESLPVRPSVLIEPFAGGSAVSVGLLEHGHVPRIALADADPLVAAFWQAVFDPVLAPILADRVRNAKVDLPEWRRLRDSQPSTTVDCAFKCLFLNRTSFSGILNEKAGPIGGYGQGGKYPISARFPRERLADRIIELSKLAPRVLYARNQDFRQTLADPLAGSSLSQKGRVFWYCDPPFWEKADRLYTHFFQHSDHLDLARSIKRAPGSWVISYDNHPDVMQLYATADGIDHVSLRYTARSKSRPDKSKELLFSNTRALRGLAGKSFAVFENTVISQHVNVSPLPSAQRMSALVRRLAADRG